MRCTGVRWTHLKKRGLDEQHVETSYKAVSYTVFVLIYIKEAPRWKPKMHCTKMDRIPKLVRLSAEHFLIPGLYCLRLYVSCLSCCCWCRLARSDSAFIGSSSSHLSFSNLEQVNERLVRCSNFAGPSQSVHELNVQSNTSKVTEGLIDSHGLVLRGRDNQFSDR